MIDETDPTVVHRLAEHLVEEAHRAVRTIDDLLKLSQIESTRPGDTVVNLTAVVQTAVARGRAVDGGRGVEITAFDTADDVLIRGDERQLISAVGNLVENAVKYSQTGDVVQVRTRVDDNAVEVMVADQGIGIPSRDLDRVFERFYRVDKARSRETGGTGLGLSIVRHVATNHGGEVLVSSQEGEGSTFVLRLPADLVIRNEGTDASSAPGADCRHADRRCRGATWPRARSTMSEGVILVVEDEASFVEALTIGLRREGFEVVVAVDGAEALAMFDEVAPDLVLLDVMLPKISGIDVCRQLRKRTQVPIIMVTAKGAEIDTVVGLEVGADDYVTKPYRLRELVARIRAVLRRSETNADTVLLAPGMIEVGDVVLDPEEHRVKVAGDDISLPLKEFELLHLLLANAGRVLPRETLIDRVWGNDYVGDTKTLDVHVKRLRSKIEPDPATPTRIVTIRGLGYKYERS